MNKNYHTLLPETANSRVSERTPARLRGESLSSIEASTWIRLWKYLTMLLLGSAEPQIWQRRDPDERITWNVYDPLTDDSASFDSENEVRVWLDSRFHHSQKIRSVSNLGWRQKY
jgi:hypothetical protein